ncbi:MAG: hypothetical protein LBL90_13705 [Prevotellaceae bacterium]|jgi:hypothetical protein|nr:hypothetical protein [Prevotellaceae bacterium]
MSNIIRHASSAVFLVLLFSLTSHAQITPDSIHASFTIYDRLIESSDNGSEIVINQDSRVESLLKQHFDKGSAGKNLRGWRIRIFRDNSQSARDRSEYLMSSFKNNNPGVPVYRSYAAPTWYVSVGDFRTRDAAEKMKKDLLHTHPGASLIETIINFPPL